MFVANEAASCWLSLLLLLLPAAGAAAALCGASRCIAANISAIRAGFLHTSTTHTE
jgi:hypothetical protein